MATPIEYRVEFRQVTGPGPDDWQSLETWNYGQPPIVPRTGEEVWISETGATWRVNQLWHFPAQTGAIRPTWELVIYVSPAR